MEADHDALTNQGTVLNFQAILSRLDFIYNDKRPVNVLESELSILRQDPVHVLESELSILRQGRMTVTTMKTRKNAIVEYLDYQIPVTKWRCK